MVIKLDGLSEKEKKAQLEFAFLYPKSFELIKQEGRVEGAISELKRFLNRVAWDGTTETEYVKKRLKELKGEQK